jgi:succinate dehydrogenase flavin-adding protein (antitoxin of CptAB toxin-antitoxin module)
MSRIEQLEEQIQALSPEELAQFRAWFTEFDWELWDQQLEQDAASAKLDALGEKALRDHASGKSTPL